MSEEKKIFVDESWKEQVEREKQVAEAQRKAAQAQQADAPRADAAAQTGGPVEPSGTGPASPAADSATAPDSPADSTAQAAPGMEIPPASMTVLISSLATQAVHALGLLPDADGKPGPVNKPIAKHFIDTLNVLEEKTQGNLTPEESAMLHNVLHEIRMAFLSVKEK